MTHSSVMIAEPQFKGATHSTVNAAMIEAVRLAFPEARSVVLSTENHGSWIRDALSVSPKSSSVGIEWRALPEVPALSRVGRVRRAAAELRVWWRLLTSARADAPEALLICSVTRIGIVLLRLLTPLLLRGTPVLVVMHQLNQLVEERGAEVRRRPVALRTLLRLPSSRELRLVAPSRFVHEELESRLPELAASIFTLSLPYLWQSWEPTPPPTDPSELVFGFFGVGRPGRIEPFCELAGCVRRRFPRARFIVVGYLDRERPDLERWQDVVEGLSTEPLPPDVFKRSAESVHYAVWTSSGSDYRMTLSASFLDALSYLKPCIFLDNPFIHRSAHALGDIGYCCADMSQMRDRVESLLGGADRDRYHQQCQQILIARRQFGPEATASTLRDLIGSS